MTLEQIRREVTMAAGLALLLASYICGLYGLYRTKKKPTAYELAIYLAIIGTAALIFNK